MATLTKQVTNVDTLGNYTLYGSSTNPINEATLEGQPISLASIVLTVSGSGSDLETAQTIIDLTGPNSGDQLIRIVLRSGGTDPTVPTDRTLLDVNVNNTDTIAEVATALNTALTNSTAIISNSIDTDKVTFSPDCGGVWSSSITGSSATVVITNGALFGTPGTRTQTGVRMTVGATGNGFNQARFTFTENHWGISTQKNVFFFANLGGTQAGWQNTSQSQNFSMRGTATTNTLPVVVAEMITSWNANEDDAGDDMIASLGEPLWELVAVPGESASFDIYALDDDDDISIPTIVRNDATVDFTVVSTTRSVNIVIPAIDPHKTTTPSQIRFFDPTATNLSQIAPNYIKTGAFSTWTMDNLSIDFGAGFRFDNDTANNTVMNWDQIDIIKSGDGEGVMFRTNVFLTQNWNNCTVKWYPLATSTNLSAFMIDANVRNITMNWDRVFIRYSGNSQMHCQFQINPNSSLLNSGIIGDGTSTGGVFNNPVVTFPLARLLTPFTFITQNRPILLTAPRIFDNVSDSYTDSSLFVGFNNGGSGVTTDTIFRPFVNQTSYFKFINFISADQIYVNKVGYQNTAASATIDPDGSSEYGVSFDPEYFDSTGTDLVGIRNEFRYGSATDNDSLQVKESFESGPIGGSAATITGVVANSTNFAVGDIFTIPRPNGLSSVTATAVSGTPVQDDNKIEFNIGSTINATIANIAASFRASTNTSLGVWFNNPLSATLSIKNFIFGNNIGGPAGLATYSGTASNVTISSLQTGASGSGTFTHPFNSGISYIDATSGLLDADTSTDNKYKANTSGSVGVGNNDGLFLTYNKSNYTNNFQAAGNAQTDISLYKSDYTVYTKRFGYRPEIISYNFSDGPQSFGKILVADIHWEEVTKTTADAYTRTSMNNMNDVYRWIENETDDRTVTGQGDLTSVYDRLINFAEPVTAAGLIDFEALNLDFNTAGTNPTYVTANTELQIPIQSSLATGISAFGATTTGNISLSNAIDFNTVRLITTGTIDVDANTTDGIFTAATIDSSGITLTNGIYNATTHTQTTTNLNGSTLGPLTSGSAFTVNHTGGNFNNVTLADNATLNTSDATLHGLTAANGIINVNANANFSVDSPGSLSNMTFNMNSITADRTFTIDEDLGNSDLVNTTSFTWTLILGANGVLPNTTAGGSLTGNFVISRTINVGLSAGDEVRYVIRNALTDALVINSTFTATASAPNIPFSSAFAIDAFIVDLTSEGYKRKEILILNNTAQEIERTFELEENLNIAIQDSSDNRQFVNDYIDDVTLTIDTSDDKMANAVCPTSFTSGGSTQTPNDNTYWDPKGSRGAGQYAIKRLARKSNYGVLTLDNKSSLSEVQPQLFQISAADTITYTTDNVQLHSEVGATVNSFFPAQFEVGPGVTNNIVGSPNGFVNIYQAANVVINTNDNLAFVKSEVGEELNERRVTRENMNNLGILAPINDADPT